MTTGSIPSGITDLHSHLVPGVDDGAASVDDVLEGVGRMVGRGVRGVVTTPHLRGSLTREPGALADRLGVIRDGFDRVAPAVRQAYPGVHFGLGCEVMLDRPDLDLTDPGLALDGSKVVLLEWPALLVPPETPPVLRGIVEQGVSPLLAHPERYSGYDSALSLVPRWREIGVLLQMNHGSLVGRYGPDPRERAFRLLANGWVDCLSSDFHGRPSLRLFIDEARALFRSLDAEATWTLLTETNPARILRGEVPLAVPPLTDERGFLQKFMSRFRPA